MLEVEDEKWRNDAAEDSDEDIAANNADGFD